MYKCVYCWQKNRILQHVSTYHQSQMIDLRAFQDFRGCTQYDKNWKQNRTGVASCQDAQKGSKTSTTFDSWAFILPGSLSTHALGNIGIQLLVTACGLPRNFYRSPSVYIAMTNISYLSDSEPKKKRFIEVVYFHFVCAQWHSGQKSGDNLHWGSHWTSMKFINLREFVRFPLVPLVFWHKKL